MTRYSYHKLLQIARIANLNQAAMIIDMRVLSATSAYSLEIILSQHMVHLAIAMC